MNQNVILFLQSTDKEIFFSILKQVYQWATLAQT